MENRGLQISNLTKQKIPKRYFLFVFHSFCEHFNKNNISAGIIFVSSRKIRSLNKKYRGIDQPTDVLSFTMDSATESKEGIVNIGDIYICPTYVEKNISSYNVKLKDKQEALGYILLHGLTHLMGYDHETYEELNNWERLISPIWKKISPPDKQR